MQFVYFIIKLLIYFIYYFIYLLLISLTYEPGLLEALFLIIYLLSFNISYLHASLTYYEYLKYVCVKAETR